MSTDGRSVRLPADIRSNSAGAGAAGFEQLGFEFGALDFHDPRWRAARLPTGWQLGIDRVFHGDRGFVVHDDRGLTRVEVSRQAASMWLVLVGRATARECALSGMPLLWDLLTPAERADALDELHEMARRNTDEPGTDAHGARQILAEMGQLLF